MTQKRRVKTQDVDDDLLGFIDVNGVDDMLEGIEEQIPPYRGGDKIEFVHAGGKFKGSVLKVLEDGSLKVADKVGTVFKISTDDICREGETASQLISRKKGERRPVYVETEEDETGKSKTTVKTKAEPLIGKRFSSTPPTKTKAKKGEKTQREKVEELAEAGETDYDVIAKKSGVTRVNVGQYMYRWKKAQEGLKKSKSKK